MAHFPILNDKKIIQKLKIRLNNFLESKFDNYFHIETWIFFVKINF